MQLRKTLGAAALITTAVFASVAGCSGRDDGDGETPDSGTGCTGACGTDSGTDAGTDAGTGPQGCPSPLPAEGPIGALRTAGERGQQVTLANVVVTAVSNVSRGSAGDFIARFWVVNPCFPNEGLYIDKFYTDPTTNYEPVVGDVLTVSGLFRRFAADAGDNTPSTRDAYRAVLKNDFLLAVPGSTGRLTITKHSSGPALADVAVPAGFGNSEGGATKPNPQFAGARVHIPGPLTITNAQPLAMKQRPEDPDSGTYLGFEVTGGVLVGNYKTFGTCDLRATVEDGGTVTFPNGIRGVYETFSNPPCLDGTTTTTADGGSSFRCNANGPGIIPGTANDYTYVVYPMNCDPDLAIPAAP
ncbi:MULTISPECIES: hypothetical protein [Myxococcus]|uniref:hypothetical protein n=1 Tax=Myxococcus TaxID=32 RepID=UPI0013D55322|nr:MULTISPECIES: hypothetical protein [Myxococcus]NVJ28119.1 hypothetical protein [Myxococcus sp. AM011]